MYKSQVKPLSKSHLGAFFKFLVITGCLRISNEALAQIERQNYSVDLEEARLKDIIKYGIAFYRKECYIVVNQQ